MKRSLALIGLILTVLACERPALAQNYVITGSVIAGGGGTSTNGNYAISGTIGQVDASPVMSGGSYAVEGGFWSIAFAVQTPGAPFLSLTRSGANVILSWPAPATGFVLEHTATVAVPASWSATAQSYSTNSGVISVTAPAASGIQFFRLKKP